MDRSGELGEEEFVLFVTILFEKVAARIASAAQLFSLTRTPPLLCLLLRFDMDRSGELGEEEFVLFVTILFENVAARVAAQVTLAGLLSPYLASKAMAYLVEKPQLTAYAISMVPEVRTMARLVVFFISRPG
jgi:hypothetical protein